MHASVHPEILLGAATDEAQEALELQTEGVQRYVWQSRYGAILIEVRDGVAYVNGDRVDPFDAGDGSAPGGAR